MDAKATFLIPVYNGAEFLRSAIESVLTQTCPDWQLIVIDDASTDESAGIAASYDDPRITLARQSRNLGQTAALNMGLSLVQTPWIARLDQDDIAAPERLAAQLAYVAAHPETVLVGCWAELIDAEGEYTGSFRPKTTPRAAFAELFTTAGVLLHSAAMFRTDAVRSVGGYPTDVYVAQDLGLWVKLGRLGEIGIVPRVLLGLRHHPSQTSRDPQAAAGLLREWLDITSELPPQLAADPGVRRAWRTRRLRVMLELILRTARISDWTCMRQSVTGSLRIIITDPLAIFRVAILAVRSFYRRIRPPKL